MKKNSLNVYYLWINTCKCIAMFATKIGNQICINGIISRHPNLGTQNTILNPRWFMYDCLKY